MSYKRTKQTWIVRNGKKAFVENNKQGAQILKERGSKLYWLLSNFAKKGTKLDTSKSQFWIVKEHPTLPKGRKIFSRKEAINASRVGKLRPITFPKDNQAMELARDISEIIDITMQNQHGFTKNKNIYTALEPHRESKTFIQFDGSSAFNTIEENTVYYIFRSVLDLNKKDARRLTDLTTIDGHMYQGCPFAPQIWNIFQWHMMHSLNKMKDITATSYADDLIISTEYEHMSWSFRRALIRIITDAGMEVNNSKTKFSHLNERTKTTHRQLGLTMERINGKTRIKPKHRARIKRKIKYFWAMYKADLRYTRRISKTGKTILIEYLIKGLAAWFTSEPPWSEIDRQKKNLEAYYKMKRAEKKSAIAVSLGP